MRITHDGNSVRLWLSANDTYGWAHKPGASWPCSFLAGKRLRADFDSNGLVDYAVNGRYAEGMAADEFNAITSDFMRDRLPKEHPCYFVAVGQFAT